MKIAYTQTARSDLRDIHEYIAHTLQAPKAAHDMTDRIMAAMRSLEELPERNPLYREEPWRSKGVRFLSVKGYLVFYTVDVQEETVTVVRIMYGGRNIDRQLKDSEEW